MRLAIGIGAAAAMTLAACGSSDDDATAPAASADDTTPAAADSTDASASSADCPFDTAAVSAAVGHDVVQGDGCEWSATDLDAAVLEVYFSGSDAMHLDQSEGEAIDGVGDAAALDVSGALVFQVGANHYVVQVISMGGATDVDPVTAQVELAQLAVSSLS